LNGSLSDADLTSLVLFVRSRPPNPHPSQSEPRVEGGWPMSHVLSNADGTVTVALSKTDRSIQRVQLRKTPAGWEVVSIQSVTA
jgi:hypothetical protein